MLLLTRTNVLKLLSGVILLLVSLVAVFRLDLIFCVTLDSLKILWVAPVFPGFWIFKIIVGYIKDKMKQKKENPQKKWTFLKVICSFLALDMLVASSLLYVRPLKSKVKQETAALYHFLGNSVETSMELDAEQAENENPYSLNANFVLRNVDLEYLLTDNLRSEVYLDSAVTKSEVQSFFAELRGTASGSTKKFPDIQSREDAFLDKIGKQPLPSEEELLAIIKEQEDFAATEGQYLIYQRLSNNYQKLAQEYDNQASYASTVKYYYWRSLQCDFQCVRYAQSNKEFNAAMERIYKRYEDIRLCCGENLDAGEKDRLNFLIDSLEEFKT